MIRIMVAAPVSGGGKTTVACALLYALKKRGLAPCAFKCGPDYIDPMYHRAALGVESRNLDLFLSDEARVTALFAKSCQGHGAAVVEGAMGFYDGLGGTTDRASSWHVADTLGLPVLLVLPARGAGLTLAAAARGLLRFRENSHITGVVLNECSPLLCKTLAPAFEAETGSAVLGCLPRLDTARIASRHLGLVTAREINDLDERLAALALAFEKNVDMTRLLALFDGAAPNDGSRTAAASQKRCRVAVARDEAFCFTYAETLEIFAQFGAEPVFFSPLHDTVLPDNIDGLYLPGGYPELYARRLSENISMRRTVAEAVCGGMPTIAECGGYLYLGAELCDGTGTAYPMVGVLPGRAADAGRLVRFGYAALTVETDSLLFRAGETFSVHEFHCWDSTENGDAFRLEKPRSGRVWRGGYASDTLYAAFPHLYFAGNPVLAERFIAAAERYGAEHGLQSIAAKRCAAD